MPHKDRDNDTEERPSERRHRTKSEKTSSRSSRSSKPKIIDPETGDVVKSPRRHRKDREKEKEKDYQKDNDDRAASMADLVPELARTASTPGSTSRTSLPYPSFNRAYSKEAVNSREDIRMPVKDKAQTYTPESTDVGSEARLRSKSTPQFPQGVHVAKDARPPSPPETEFSQQRKGTPTRMSKLQEDEETEQRPSSRTSWLGRAKKDDERSRLSSKSKTSKASTAVKAPRTKAEDPTKGEKQPDANRASSDSTGSRDPKISAAPKPVPSDVSGLAPPTLDTYSSPDSAQDSSPMTPTPTQQFPSISAADIKPAPSPYIPFEASEGDMSAFDSPQPPPPPPPPTVPINVPRVDYLLQNGGLSRPVSKMLLSTTPNYLSQNSTPRASTPMPSEIERIFGPYFTVLDQYETVISKNGSLAVATGYRSVARRLLDRLENVFNRDLSSEGCLCVMCQKLDQDEGSRGLGWGDVLEWVSGRRELPVWPAFDFATLGVKTADDLTGLGLSDGRTGIDPARPRSPVKIDPDVAEEFREHYLQQSKKTKLVVDRWLSSCPQTIATPPQEVDDETLSFAIVTHLEQQDRPIFNALLSGSSTVQPASRAPTPLRKPRSDFITKTVHSLQRLYRLPTPPRDPEAAIYLFKNPHVHHLIATLSSISISEWEILTSGRFDGFLWSGAESELESPAISRGPTPLNGNSPRGPVSGIRQGASRTTTPFSAMRSQTFSPPFAPSGAPSRGPTPFSQLRHPVSNDEETEIATLAEVEREIYLGMEMLEDAFEGLHRKAELVRRALRERGAGLSMAMQSRRTSHPDIISASTPGIPSTGLGLGYERPQWGDGSEMASESDFDPVDELQSELAPDDSASNISSSRHRRPKRRNERRTPALVEEEDED